MVYRRDILVQEKMMTLITLAVVLALIAAGYSFYLHRKLASLKQVIDDLKALVKGETP